MRNGTNCLRLLNGRPNVVIQLDPGCVVVLRSAFRFSGLTLFALLLLPHPAVPASAAIDVETYAPCSTTLSVVAPCNGAVGGGPSPTLLCYVSRPADAWFDWASVDPTWNKVSPPPLPNAAGGSPAGCVNTPAGCNGGPFPWPGPIPPPSPPCQVITMPSQLMGATSFWDALQGAGYILGGFTSITSAETAQILRFDRGMPIQPYGTFLPAAPGGTFNGAQFAHPGSMPAPRGNQALAWDPVSRTAYVFGGYNGGALTNQIVAYRPDTQTSTVLPTTLPFGLDLVAGAWNPTPTPTCPQGCAYLFGGRMGQLQEVNGVNVNCVGHTDRVYLYEPISERVIESPWRLPQSLYGMTAVSVGNQIYVFGGAHQDEAIVADENAAPNPQVWVCDPTAQRNYAGDLGLTGLPSPVINCDIFRFNILEGATLTRVNPYQKPTDVPAGPAWSAGTGVAATNFCPGMRPAGFYDGRYIFAQAAATQRPCSLGLTGGMFRLDPTTPIPTPWTLGGFTAPISNMGCQSNGPGHVGQLGFTTGFFTGCSGYVFGGLIDPTGLIGPPAGPVSDKIIWFGKCRPTATVESNRQLACVGWPVRLDGSKSMRGEADIAWVEWDFGDGTKVGMPWQPWPVLNPAFPDQVHPANGQTMQHPYQEPGSYFVTMRITDLSGFQSTPPPLLVKVKQDGTCKAWTHEDPHRDPVLPQLVAAGGAEVDSDLDGVPDLADNCPGVPNHDQEDVEADGLGDVCDEATLAAGAADPGAPVSTGLPDGDRDGVSDAVDNCVARANHNQSDVDGDKAGDVCDPDADGDLVANDAPGGAFLDNCPLYPNSDQADSNGDGTGDACVLQATAPPAPAEASGGDAAPARPAGFSAAAIAVGMLAAAVAAACLILLLRRGMKVR